MAVSALESGVNGTDTDAEETATDLGFGQPVYDEDGVELGTVRGFDEHGFYVTVEEGIEALSSEHRSAGAPGEATLMWRCWECGEMGDIAEMPDACPDCDAPKESLYYWEED